MIGKDFEETGGPGRNRSIEEYLVADDNDNDEDDISLQRSEMGTKNTR